MKPEGHGGRGEEGAVAVIVAITLTALLMASALVLDLGALRLDRVQSKAVADVSALAAAYDYEPGRDGDMQRICDEAIAYAEGNLANDITLTAVSSCLDVFADDLCTNEMPARSAVYESGPYTVTITMPVPDAHPAMEGILIRDGDGLPCDRVGVAIERSRNFLFAPAGGSDLVGGRTIQSSVAVSDRNIGEPIYASLVVLEAVIDSNQCTVIEASGGGRLRVLDGIGADGESVPGSISVDSLPTGSCNSQVFSLSGVGSRIEATGSIFSFALASGVPRPDVYREVDVTGGTPNLAPRPRSGPAIRRTLVDDRFNCLDYSTYPTAPWSPAKYPQLAGTIGVDILDCADDNPPLIKDLHDAHVTPATSTFTTANGWNVFPVPGASCDGATAAGTYGPAGIIDPTGAAVDLPAGTDGSKWFVDCPGVGNGGFQPADLAFVDVTHIVTAGRISLSGNFSVTSPGLPQGTTVVVRQGGIERGAGHGMTFLDSFIYLADDSSSANMQITGGSGQLVWDGMLTADGTTACGEYITGSVPTAACFAPVTYWANGISSGGPGTYNRLTGNSTGRIAGTFFSPNAITRLTGTDSEPKIDFEGAQFFATQLQGRGGGTLELVPDPEQNLETYPPAAALIR